MEPQVSKESKDSPEFKIIFDSETKNKPPESGYILDKDALGRLRRELVWTVGEDRLKGIMARLGFTRGQTDGQKDESPPPFLKNFGTLNETESDSQIQEYILESKNSCEAEEHLRFFLPPIKNSQCWLLSGYLTGFLSSRTKKSIYFLEVQCRAKNDPTCRFIGRTKKAWGDEFEIALSVYSEDNMAVELKDTREQLKLTKDRYQSMFEQSSLPILIIDPETGTYLDANLATEDITGYKHDEICQLNVFDLRPPSEHHIMANYLKALISDEPIDSHDMTLIRKDGARRTIIQSSKVLSFGGRSVVQIILKDITDLKESALKEKDLQSQLIRSERLSSIGRLAAGVAHELKNPLGAIRNAVYYIQNALAHDPIMEKDPHLKKILKLVESEVDGSVAIIGELLDFSRVVELVPRKTQINNLLDILPNIITVPENVKIEMDLDMTLPSAYVDPERLNQVFSNLFSNAIQSMFGGGKLVVRSRREIQAAGDDKERIELINVIFEDTGKGVEPVHLKKIFEPLFTTKARGTGLGLAISSNIIEKHGGVIQVASLVGKGTTFTIKLPLNGPKDREDGK